MAEGKKSFVAYADWKEIFDTLPNEDAGALIKHIFAYVNDENPISESVLINAVFANIKNTLKRDLQKWETQLEQRRNAGRKSAEVRSAKSNDRSIPLNETERKSTDSVSVSDNVLLEKETKHIYAEDVVVEEKPKRVPKKFVPPTKEEVISYFTEKGYRSDIAIKAFEYYHVADWHDSKGKKVVNWKQKVQANWFKDEYKISDKPILQPRQEDVQYNHIMNQIKKFKNQ